MYERFTDRARKVMRLANQEAQRFNHEYIGTEHILLGLVKEGSGVAANVLKNLDIDLRKIRLEVEKIVQSGPDDVLLGKLPQTPRARKAIEYAIEEARALNHNYVGTEHLLLGLLREQEGLAAQILINLGLSLEGVRREVLALLGMGTEGERGGEPKKDVARLPGSIRQKLRDLETQIQQLDVSKEEAVAGQDFERAAQLRDEADKLKKHFDKQVRAWQGRMPQVVSDCELYVSLRRNDGSLIDPARLGTIRERLRQKFGAVVESRIQIDGWWRVGPATLHDEVLVYRVLSTEPAQAQVFLLELKVQLKADLQHDNVLILIHKAKGL